MICVKISYSCPATNSIITAMLTSSEVRKPYALLRVPLMGYAVIFSFLPDSIVVSMYRTVKDAFFMVVDAVP